LWIFIAAICGLLLGVPARTVVFAQQPTNTPASPDVTTSGMYITVTSTEPQINVRMGPGSIAYPIVGQLLNGATAPALGRSPGGDWVQIGLPGAPGGVGWVYAPLVTLSPGTLRIVEPPPTPAPPATPTIDPTLAAQFNVAPTSTRLPTFTPPAPLTKPVFDDSVSASFKLPVPIATLIIFFAVVGSLGFILSLFRRRR
jgi:hypothetical protein